MPSPTPSQQLQPALHWVGQQLQCAIQDASVLDADASRRQYCRIRTAQGDTHMLMLSPPELGEKNDEFVAVASLLRSLGINAPEILHLERQRGWMLLTDFGDLIYLRALQQQPDRQMALYRLALRTMVRQHSCPKDRLTALEDFAPPRMIAEAGTVHSWYLQQLLRTPCAPALWRECQREIAALAEQIARQPQVLTHFDFHSRNLLVLEENSPAVLDFQDAVVGPVGLDPVSLLRDCYHELSESTVRQLLGEYLQLAIKAEVLAADLHPNQLFVWFNQCGLQRHLRVLGTFARLVMEQGKRRYLDDIPMALKYARRACSYLPDTAALAQLLQSSEKPLAQIMP